MSEPTKYQDAWDAGYDKGWDDGFQEAMRVAARIAERRGQAALSQRLYQLSGLPLEGKERES